MAECCFSSLPGQSKQLYYYFNQTTRPDWFCSKFMVTFTPPQLPPCSSPQIITPPPPSRVLPPESFWQLQNLVSQSWPYSLLPHPLPSPPHPSLHIFSLHPFAPPSQTHSATAMQLSAADAAELITVSFISRLAAQRDLGIDEMPADWWLLNRLLLHPWHILADGGRREGGSGRRRFKHQKRPKPQLTVWL